MAGWAKPARLQRDRLRLRLGHLAIAALLLGAPQAVGTDIDIQAIEASRDNAGRNNIDPARFPLYLPEDMPQAPADVVVANILAGPLVALAPQITRLVKAGGRLALSGILAEQAERARRLCRRL